MVFRHIYYDQNQYYCYQKCGILDGTNVNKNIKLSREKNLKSHLLTGVEQSLLLAASFVTWLDRLYLCLLFLSLLLLLFVVGHFNPLYNLLNRS